MPVFRKEQIVGVRLGQTFAQMACYRNTMNEPEMVTGPQSQRQYDVDPKVWEELNSEEGDCPALKSFFENFLGWGHFLEHPEDLRIMVTVRQLGRKLWTKIPDALESLGIPRRCIFLQDYPASFFYYTLHQRKELWSNDVALLECRDGVMSGQILHIDRSKIPALCTVTEAASDRIDESVRGGRDDENWNKVLSDEDTITVTVAKPAPAAPAEEGEKAFGQKVLDFFAKIFDFFKSIFKHIGDFFAGLNVK